MAVITYREALNEALAEEMERDPDVFLMGEEVGVYNGAYKVSKGLLDRFGEMRVVDTPITELGFTGLGVGAAMTGLRPVIEFMTYNFSVLAFDQVVHSAAKMLSMSGGQFKIPITFRGPTGAALQLSAQHSQALEAMYSHFPGMKVVVPGTPADAKGLLKAAIRDDDPVAVFEGEMLYNIKGEVPEDDDFVIQEEAFDHLDAPVLRVTQADVPMPYAKGLEKRAKPSADLVVEKVNQVLYR
jgi:pyruvate dehydrogenase E1 component beta subunit